MPFPAEFQSDVVLRDGSTVTLRPLRDSDRAPLLDLARELPRGTLYTRFFATPRSAAAEIESLLGGQRGTHFVLVAESGGVLVGVSAYCRDAKDAGKAEVTLAVATRFQGRGLGTLLLESMAALAYDHGIRVFDAFVLTDNARMLRVFADSGFTASDSMQAGVHHVVLALAPSPTRTARVAARSQTAASASMRPFFQPTSVAVVGANRARGRIGSEVLHNILAGGYTGRLVVVHPSASEVQGVPAFPTLVAVPDPVDLAVVCVPAADVLGVVDDAIAKGVRGLVVITAGFGEIGAEGRAREAELVARVRQAGMRMVGPNCMGLINTAGDIRLQATFSPVSAPPGHVGMSTQSGALGLAILDYARRLHIGFSTFVSVGNKADVSSNDLIQYWSEDPNTRVIVLYLESFGNPTKFSEIARRVGRQKPIVAVKAGRSAVGARAASSHTGALASRDAIVDALFRQSGVIRTATIEELFDVATLLANQPVPSGPRVAILTNAGGPGILAADACAAHGLDVAPLAEATRERLRGILPPTAAVTNPVDMIASASADQFEQSLRVLLADPAIDSVLTIFIPPMVTRGEDVARAIQRAAAGVAKPVLAVFMSADPAPPMLAPVPSFTFPESAALALARATEYGAWRVRPQGSTPDFPDLDIPAARAVVDQVLTRGGGWASADEAQQVLRAARIAMPGSCTVETEAAAVAAATQLGYPVALKAIGPRILHKTELDAVRLGLSSAEDVRAAWQELQRRLRDQMTGGFVQQMAPAGVEMLVGVVTDPTFGPVLACASGGRLTEIIADSQFRLFPLTDVEAASMIDGLKVARLLRGFRGAPPADEPALREALLRLSALLGVCPEIQELDINPLTVLTQGALALDVRICIERARPRPLARRISY